MIAGSGLVSAKNQFRPHTTLDGDYFDNVDDLAGDLAGDNDDGDLVAAPLSVPP